MRWNCPTQRRGDVTRSSLQPDAWARRKILPASRFFSRPTIRIIVWVASSPSTEALLQFEAVAGDGIRAPQPILEGSFAGNPPENNAKIALIAETCFESDIGDSLVRVGELVFCLIHAKSIQVRDKRLPRDFFEKIHE